MNFSNITSKITQNADNIGKLYGYLAPMAAAHPGDPINSIFEEHKGALEAIMQGKFPKLQNILDGFLKFEWGASPFKMGLIAYLIGALGEGLPIIDKFSTPLQKFGAEAMKYSIISAAIITWDWNPHAPSDMTGGSPSPGSPSNYGY